MAIRTGICRTQVNIRYHLLFSYACLLPLWGKSKEGAILMRILGKDGVPVSFRKDGMQREMIDVRSGSAVVVILSTTILRPNQMD